MLFGLISPLGLLTAGLYFYVAVAIIYAERKADAGWGKALTKGFTWPATIWSSIQKLYETPAPPKKLGY